MIPTPVHPLDLRVGQRIHFDPAPASETGACGLDGGRIAAKALQGVLVEAGVTLAGTKVLLLVPHERITGVWLEPPMVPVRMLLPVSRERPHASPHRPLSRIFRDTSQPLAPASGAHSLDDDRTPWAS
jgi:hypothetical protein